MNPAAGALRRRPFGPMLPVNSAPDQARRDGAGMDEDFRKAALDYHRLPRPGKLAVEPTKRMASQRDLALAYSPGVAAACQEIAADPATRRSTTPPAAIWSG